jgi:hypothetical protein
MQHLLAATPAPAVQTVTPAAQDPRSAAQN